MKICMPQHWHAQSVSVVGNGVLLLLANGLRYNVCRENVGELSFQVLDGGAGKSDEILERIWNTTASEQKA
jgi:hypothetical protein